MPNCYYIDADLSGAKEQEEYSLGNSKASSKVESHEEEIDLLIVRHFCRFLDASVEVDTQQGEETTFKTVFPLELYE